MFRIERDLVILSPMRVKTMARVMESVCELPINLPEELPNNAGSRSEVENEPESPQSEPEAPACPTGPTPEELAAERAEEIIRQAGEKAAELVEKAQRRSDELIRMAAEESEQMCEAARKRGYDEGAEEARAEVSAELEVKMREDDDLLRSVIDAMHDERSRMLAGLEGEVVKLTLAIAEKIIKLADKNDDKIFENMIVNALKQVNLEGKITIRVGVREYERFFSSGSAVFTMGDGATVSAAVMKDTALGEGDLIIDSDDGTINVGIDSQLRYIELALNRTGDV